MQLFKGSYVNLAAGSRQLWPYSNDNAGGLAIVVKLSQLSEKRMFMFRTTSEPRAFPCDIPAAGRSLFTKYWVREFWVWFTNNPAGNKTKHKISQNLVQQSVI